jgi:hypothetical protein
VFLMIMLFLAFLKVSLQAVRGELHRHFKEFLLLTALKLFLLRFLFILSRFVSFRTMPLVSCFWPGFPPVSPPLCRPGRRSYSPGAAYVASSIMLP